MNSEDSNQIVCLTLPAIPNLVTVNEPTTITISNVIPIVKPLQCHLKLFDHTKLIVPIADEITHTHTNPAKNWAKFVKFGVGPSIC